MTVTGKCRPVTGCVLLLYLVYTVYKVINVHVVLHLEISVDLTTTTTTHWWQYSYSQH